MTLIIFCKDKSTQKLQISSAFQYNDDAKRRKLSFSELENKAKVTSIDIVTASNYFGHKLIND